MGLASSAPGTTEPGEPAAPERPASAPSRDRFRASPRARICQAPVTVFVLLSDPASAAALRPALGPRVVVSSLWSELAPRLIHASPGDVLITEVEMPAICGVELARVVRRYNPDLRIVFYTTRPHEVPPELAEAVIARAEGEALLLEALGRFGVPAVASSDPGTYD